MPPLYVTTQLSKLRIANRRLSVDLEGETLASIPLSQVTQVVLFV